MFSWNKKSKEPLTADQPQPSRPAPRFAAVPTFAESGADLPAVKELTLITAGFPRVEPANEAEAAFAAQYRAAAQDARATFSDGGFNLPNLPGSAMKLLNLLQAPDVSTRKLGRAILRDPIITAKFLRMANSPMYACDRRIKSVQVAIERMGLDMVEAVVLAIAVNSTIIKTKRLGDAAVTLWKHSFNTAMAAQAMAATVGLDQAEAFVLGLMHDIGNLPALLLVDELATPQTELNTGLCETLVADAHAAMGRTLTEIWQLPVEMCLVAGGHHAVTSCEEAVTYCQATQPKTSPEQILALAQLLECVILADRSLAALGLAREPGDLSVSGTPLALNLGLNEEQATQYLQRLPGLLRANDL